MVHGKTVTFRDGSCEKSPSPKRFEEPEGMTDVDLRRLSELSGFSGKSILTEPQKFTTREDSSVKKFDPKTVKKTLIKAFAIFTLLGATLFTLVLIFNQAPLGGRRGKLDGKFKDVLIYIADKVEKCKQDKTLESCCKFVGDFVIQDCTVDKVLEAIGKRENMLPLNINYDVSDLSEPDSDEYLADFLKMKQGDDESRVDLGVFFGSEPKDEDSSISKDTMFNFFGIVPDDDLFPVETNDPFQKFEANVKLLKPFKTDTKIHDPKVMTEQDKISNHKTIFDELFPPQEMLNSDDIKSILAHQDFDKMFKRKDQPNNPDTVEFMQIFNKDFTQDTPKYEEYQLQKMTGDEDSSDGFKYFENQKDRGIIMKDLLVDHEGLMDKERIPEVAIEFLLNRGNLMDREIDTNEGFKLSKQLLKNVAGEAAMKEGVSLKNFQMIMATDKAAKLGVPTNFFQDTSKAEKGDESLLNDNYNIKTIDFVEEVTKNIIETKNSTPDDENENEILISTEVNVDQNKQHNVTQNVGLQTTAKIANMKTPTVDEVDVNLDLVDTNINITYSNPFRIRRQVNLNVIPPRQMQSSVPIQEDKFRSSNNENHRSELEMGLQTQQFHQQNPLPMQMQPYVDNNEATKQYYNQFNHQIVSEDRHPNFPQYHEQISPHNYEQLQKESKFSQMQPIMEVYKKFQNQQQIIKPQTHEKIEEGNQQTFYGPMRQEYQQYNYGKQQELKFQHNPQQQQEYEQQQTQRQQHQYQYEQRQFQRQHYDQQREFQQQQNFDVHQRQQPHNVPEAGNINFSKKLKLQVNDNVYPVNFGNPLQKAILDEKLENFELVSQNWRPPGNIPSSKNVQVQEIEKNNSARMSLAESTTIKESEVKDVNTLNTNEKIENFQIVGQNWRPPGNVQHSKNSQTLQNINVDVGSPLNQKVASGKLEVDNFNILNPNEKLDQQMVGQNFGEHPEEFVKPELLANEGTERYINGQLQKSLDNSHIFANKVKSQPKMLLEHNVFNSLENLGNSELQDNSDMSQIRLSNHPKVIDFTSTSENVQSSQLASFQKPCTYSPNLGTQLSLIQQQIPYQYDPTPKLTQLVPIIIPRTPNSYVINPQYTYVSSSLPQQQLGGYGGLFGNGQMQQVQAAGPRGQFYVCNPIAPAGNQVATIPGVAPGVMEPRLLATKQNATARESNDCPFGYQQCTNSDRCIKSEDFCDGEVQCEDGSDEAYCSCRDRVAPIRRCDGYYDCPNGEDEVGCFGCEPHHFNCDDWSYNRPSTCIPLRQRCDGIPNCPTGIDERDCSALLDYVETSEDPFKVSNNVGFLHRNFQGQWFPACYNPEVWALEACKDETAPSVLPPVTQMVAVQHDYTGAFINSETVDGIKIVDHCVENRAVYVECPQPTCGMRKLFQNPYRREEVDTSGEEIRARFNPKPEIAKEYFRNILQGALKVYDSKKTVPTNSTKDDMIEDSSLKRNSEDSDLRNNRPTNVTKDMVDRNIKFLNGTEDAVLGGGRVVGGRPCQPGAWPWVVSIYKNGAFHCGGVLISDSWLITAAHCVEKYWMYYYEVELGMLRRFSYSPMQQTRYVSNIVPHPNYDRNNLKNDLALMKLQHPVKFNRYVKPVCLPTEYTAGQHYDIGPLPGTVCTAVGWGATIEHGSDPDHMREVEVPVLPYCKHKEDEEGQEICAGLMEGGKDACQGDSGGPFLCRNPNIPEQWYLAGIVSHGEGCARPNEPGVYTRIPLYRNWIYENARENTGPSRRPLQHCPGYTCRTINKCIPRKRYCDKIVDCLYGDDEVNCDRRSSFSSMFRHMILGELSRSTGPEDPPATETTPGVDSISDDATLKMENSRIMDTVDGSGSFASPVQLSDPDEFITNEDADGSADDGDKERWRAKSGVNGTVMIKPFKGERFLCGKMLQVIPASKKCDKVVDCEDGSDEMGCKCADYLKRTHQEALCDGITDCADLSDEEGCASCGGDGFHCRLSGSCIPIEKKCDNRADCDRNEDEWDCLALADGDGVHVDEDARPVLSSEGIFAANVGGRWAPVCFNFTGIEGQTATDVCVALGFSDYERYMQVHVFNKTLPVVKAGTNSTIIGLPPGDKCSALFVRCVDVSVSAAENIEEELQVLHTAPWNAHVYSDAKYQCSGTILTNAWILTSISCFPGILELRSYYVAVLLGSSKSYLSVGGPHEQIIPVVESLRVADTDAVLLRLKNHLEYTRYVRPLHFKRKGDFVRYKEICTVTGIDRNGKPRAISLKPIQNCSTGFRCFKRLDAPHTECEVSGGIAPWSGCVVCDSGNGFYPAATYHENEGFCGFKHIVALPSIAEVKRDIFQIIGRATFTVNPPPCNGFRCTLGECIPKENACNALTDCRDASDEDPEYCAKVNESCHQTATCVCLPDEMRCRNGRCVPKRNFCDHNNDCGDGSDEPDRCNCRAYLELADSKKICDGIRHCLDKSDEDGATCNCTENKFKCDRSSQCVPNDVVCDGQKDCPDNEDEEQCMSLLSTDDNPQRGEVMTRTSGVWHPGCFENHLTITQLEEICARLGFLGGSASRVNSTLEKAPRPYQDKFSIIWIHRGSSHAGSVRLALRSGLKEFVHFEEDSSCHRLSVECL